MQTLGGVFALAPDWIYVIHFYPSLGLGEHINLEDFKAHVHENYGNWFFFHAAIDQTGEGNFLRGFILTVAQYNVWLLVFLVREFWTRPVRRTAVREPVAEQRESGRKSIYEDYLKSESRRRRQKRS